MDKLKKRARKGLRFSALFLLLAAFVTVPLAACQNDGDTDDSGSGSTSATGNYVTIEMADDLGTIIIELIPEEAPITVANFQQLTADGFYDGLTFHRIVPGFVVQGGDPRGDGTGGSAEQIKGEFASNGVDNSILHGRGIVSMARSGQPDSASSQFYIVLSDNNVSHLDGDYAAFGRVLSGMEVVDKIVENHLMGTGNTPVMDKVTLSEENPLD